MERLIAVRLGARDVVLDALLERRPLVMDQAQHVVARRDVVHQHPHREEIVDLLERLVTLAHLLVDRPQVFRPAGDLDIGQPGLPQLPPQRPPPPPPPPSPPFLLPPDPPPPPPEVLGPR